MNKKCHILLAGAAALILSGCAKNSPQALPPTPGPSIGETGSGIIPGSHADFLAQMNGGDVIYFDFDRFNIDSKDIVSLQTQAQWLARYPNKRATIEGHCDERGTRDYNIALGERRANAAKNYLVSLGVAPDRLSTISYGKERPAATGSDENAWALNRRAVTITID